jgi:hypothetical protein
MTATTVLDILPRRPRPIAALERYQGLSASAGTRIAGWEHLRQSVLDILTTYPGERIMRPEYGSRVRDLIDRPVNAQWLADLYFEVAYAIQRWEPRVRVLKVGAAMTTPGHVTIDLTLRVGAIDETPQAMQIDI